MPDGCGDGVVQSPEECDDGNTIGDDKCANDCTFYVPPVCPDEYVVCDDELDLAAKDDPQSALAAMGVCNQLGGDSVLVTDFEFAVPDGLSWQVARGFGSHEDTPGHLLFSPREGEAMLLITTGQISAPNADGVVIEADNSQGLNNDNGNPDMPDLLPPPLHYEVGSNGGAGGTPFAACDGVNDCSDTLYEQWVEIGNSDPNDQLFFRFEATVPLGTRGYSFDLVFCSAEWPNWVDAQYNDVFIGWQADPTAGGYTGSLAYVEYAALPDELLPVTVTGLDPYFMSRGYKQNAPELAGTGFNTNACTEWLHVRGGAQPGAHLTLGFYLTDMGDSILASMAILDNFRWDCDGCELAEDCGIQVD